MSTRGRVIILVIITLFMYYIFTRIQKKRASEALQDLFDLVDKLESIEIKMASLLSQNIYDGLVNNHVKAATDEIGSIRKQTEIYESMQRIPGGPQNFMENAQAQLEKLNNELFSWEQLYSLSTARFGREWDNLGSEIDRCELKLEHTHRMQISLAPLQIYINPSDQLLGPEPNNPIPLYETIELMKNRLLPIVQEFEKIKIENSESPFFESNDIFDIDLIPVLRKLQIFVESNKPHFERVGRLMVQKLNDIKEKTHDLLVIDKARERYEELALQVDTDIASLRERINNLKYPKKYKEDF